MTEELLLELRYDLCSPPSSILWISTYSPCVRMLKSLVLIVASCLSSMELANLALQGWTLPLLEKTY